MFSLRILWLIRCCKTVISFSKGLKKKETILVKYKSIVLLCNWDLFNIDVYCKAEISLSKGLKTYFS